MRGSFCSLSGFSFDLSPLTKKDGSYKVETEKYDFYINVCAAVSGAGCQPGSGACQVAKRQVTLPSYGCSFRCPGLTGGLRGNWRGLCYRHHFTMSI